MWPSRRIWADLKTDGDTLAQYDGSIRALKTAISETERKLARVKQQVDTVKATEAVQRAQSAVAARHSGANGKVGTALDSLERIQARQAERGARMTAAAQLESEANGGELDACVDEMLHKLDCVEICLAAYSLKQMKKSGRVSAAAAVVGDLLGIRPIISLNDGVSKVEAKVRGDAAVIPAMLKWVSTRVDDMRDTPYMMAYTSSTQKRDELLKLCKKEFGHPPMCTFQLGCAVSANTPPGNGSRRASPNASTSSTYRRHRSVPVES